MGKHFHSKQQSGWHCSAVVLPRTASFWDNQDYLTYQQHLQHKNLELSLGFSAELLPDPTDRLRNPPLVRLVLADAAGTWVMPTLQ